MATATLTPFSPALRSAAGNSRVAGSRGRAHWISGGFSFLAGLLTPFTVSLVGEIPLGEVVLMAVVVWTLVCAVFNRTWPGPLLRHPLLGKMLVAQLIAFAAYVASDLYRHSSGHDMARGWARMLFLAIDIVALAYLFGREPRNFLWLLLGGAVGDTLSAWWLGPIFGDMWKFGVGTPLTVLALALAPFAGALAAAAAAIAMALVHFHFDYRSYGGICLLAGMLILLQGLPRQLRLWLAPLGAVVGVAGIVFVYSLTQAEGQRATRSNVERSAMMTAAAEAFVESPLIGHGSWFSNSRVYDNFLILRHDGAQQAHVGGFADPNADPGNMTLHSQILVALAEGGIFGGAFFFVFGCGLVWALWRLVFAGEWNRLSPLAILVLLSALWNLCFSPFSGAHRVYIAVACGLILLVPRPRARANAGTGRSRTDSGPPFLES